MLGIWEKLPWLFFSEYLRILELEEKGSQKQLLELEVHDRVRRLAFLFSVKGQKYTSHKGWDTGLHGMPASLKSPLEGHQTERNSVGRMAIGQKEPHVWPGHLSLVMDVTPSHTYWEIKDSWRDGRGHPHGSHVGLPLTEPAWSVQPLDMLRKYSWRRHSLMDLCYHALAFNKLSLQFIHHLREMNISAWQEVQQPTAISVTVIDLLALGKWPEVSSFSAFLPSNFLQVLSLTPQKININIPMIESRCSTKRWDTSMFVTSQSTAV